MFMINWSTPTFITNNLDPSTIFLVQILFYSFIAGCYYAFIVNTDDDDDDDQDKGILQPVYINNRR